MEARSSAPSRTKWSAGIHNFILILPGFGFALGFAMLVLASQQFVVVFRSGGWLPTPSAVCTPHQVCWADLYWTWALFFGLLQVATVRMLLRDAGMRRRRALLLMPVSPTHTMVGATLWEGVIALLFDHGSRGSVWVRRSAILIAGAFSSLLLHTLIAVASGTAILSLQAAVGNFHWVNVGCSVASAVNIASGRPLSCAIGLREWFAAETLAAIVLVCVVSLVVDWLAAIFMFVRAAIVIVRIGVSERPIVNDLPPAVHILHLSDLHVVATDTARRCEAPTDGPAGNGLIEKNLLSLCHEFGRAHAVIISGDITDCGDPSEWREFLRLVDKLPATSRKRLFIVPGNHDLNLIEKQFRRADTKGYGGYRQRGMLFLAVLLYLQGDRCDVAKVDPRGKVVWLALGEALGAHADLLHDVLERVRKGDTLPEVPQDFDFSSFIPYVWRLHDEAYGQIAFVGINTCVIASNVLTNALGRFDIFVLEGLVSELIATGHLPVVVGHHHILPIFEVKHGEGRHGASARSVWTQVKSAILLSMMAAQDGVRTYAALRKVAASRGFVYLHGHRHVHRSLREVLPSGAEAMIAGAASLIFGDEFRMEPLRVGVAYRLLIRPGAGSTTLASIHVVPIDASAA